MKITKILITLAVAALISACESEPSEDLQDSIVETTPETNDTVNPSALFDPASSVIPFPNNLLFSGSLDGTLNIPVADAADLSNPQVALNSLDGFSTVAPMSTEFSTAIDATSVTPTSVKMYEVSLSGPGGAVVNVDSQLTFGVDFFATLSSVDSSQSTLAILPLKPLDANTSYMVVITDDLMTSSSTAFGPSVTYRLIKNIPNPLVFGDPTIPGALQSLTVDELASFEGLRQIVNVSEGTVAAFDAAVGASDIILSWSFTTQSVGDVLTVVQGLVGTPATSLSPSTVNLGLGAGLSPAGAANVFEGSIDIPYYLTAPSVANPVANLSNPWQAENAVAGENNLTGLNPLPAVTDTVTIPLMVTTPVDTATFPAPWKTVIFQHGITSDRTAMLAVADSLAEAGFAVVAIDMALHGVGNSSPFYQTGNERTFDVDFVTQDVDGNITAAAPDSTIDSSGRHFINLTNLLVTRDNLRQSVADLFALTAAIPSIDVDGGGADLDGSEIYFVGHSLGAMVGITFTALEIAVKDAVFAFGGGSLPKILDGSAAFSPSIVAGLAASGVNKGTAGYESFLGAAQTVVDAADPINHAEDAATGRGVLFFEIVGGGGSTPSDLVVPNTVPDGNDSSNTVPAPLAGTEPVLELMGLNPPVNSDQISSDLQHSVKFLFGNHSSLLSPAADVFNTADTNLAVTTEMQTIMATFLGSDGAFIDITNDTLLQAPPP